MLQNLLRLGLLCIVGIFFVGCDGDILGNKRQYELVEIKGKIYLLNKENGQVFIKDGDHFYQITRYDAVRLRDLRRAKRLSVDPLKGLAFTVLTKYWNN
jgi:hypothetical protein